MSSPFTGKDRPACGGMVEAPSGEQAILPLTIGIASGDAIAGEATRKCYDAGRHDPTADPDLTTDNAVGVSDDLTAHVTADLRNRPEPDDPNDRGYVVPPAPPGEPRPWTEYRRGPTVRVDAQPTGPQPTGPAPGRGGPGHNPYQPR